MRALRVVLPLLLLAGISAWNATAQDRMVIGNMAISGGFSAYSALPLPAFTNQKFCSLLQLGPNLIAWAYVPTNAERTGNYSSFPMPLPDPIATGNAPFPNNIIPPSRLPNPIGWRIAPAGPAAGEPCVATPSLLPQFTSIDYVTGVNASLDTITAGPATLTYSYQQGAALPAIQQISVQAGRTALNYAIFTTSGYVQNGVQQTSPPTWLTVEGACCQLTGTRAGIVMLPNELVPGTYQATITVVAIDAINPPITITINLNVTAPPNYLVVSTKNLDFTYTLGSAFPPSKSFEVLSLGGAGTFTAAATPVTPLNVKWFTVTPTTGSSPATVTVNIDPNQARLVGRGKFFGYVDVYGGTTPSGSSAAGDRPFDQTSTTPANSPQRVGITLTVFPNPDFTITPQTVSFQVTPGASAPGAQMVALAPIQGLNYQFVNDGFGVQVTPLDPNDAGMIQAMPSPISIAGQLSIGVNPSAIQNLTPGEHDAVVSFVGPGDPDITTGNVIPVAVVSFPPASAIAAANPPSISSVISAGANVPGLTPGGWVAIYGTSLAAAQHILGSADIVGGQLPQSLAGTSVIIDGRAAALSYVGPTQINALVPDISSRGPVNVVVTTAVSPAATVSATMSDAAPAFFPFPNNHVAAQHADYTNVGNPTDVPGATPAHPGETILLYGTGFGPTNPPTPSGPIVTTAYSLANTVTVTIGNQSAQVLYAGITEAGLCQINVVVPAVPDGEQPIVAQVQGKGVSTQSGVNISVKN